MELGASKAALRRTSADGIPDLKWINRSLPIENVARKLDLRFGEHGMIHCWHPERHKNGDRTPSVSIRNKTNSIRCFGCGQRPMSVVDLVVDVFGSSVADAATWLAQNFEVRRIPAGKHLAVPGTRPPYLVGMEEPLELLVRSGLWAHLSVPAQQIAPVLLSFAEADGQERFQVRISFRAIQRYSGLRSPNAVSNALNQLAEIGWLQRAGNASNGKLLRDTGSYVLTPFSEQVKERGNTLFVEEREIIRAEKELRSKQRRDRRSIMATRSRQNGRNELRSLSEISHA